MNPIQIQVFISSPSDAAEERRRARCVVNSLCGVEIGGCRLQVAALLWEDSVPADIGQPAQAAVDYYLGRASQVDIYVGIFWTRLGSPAVIHNWRHESGTIYEFKDAYKNRRRTGRPKMLLYRCVRPPEGAVDEEQQAAVDRFFAGFRGEAPLFEGLHKEFNEAEQFAGLLERDLRRVLEAVVAERRAASVASPGGSRNSVLLESVQSFLSNYEEMFGEGREKEHPFPIFFRELPYPPAAASEAVLPEAGSSLVDLFERRSRRMLIVGQAGAGKTFALLTLMQDLIDRARENPSFPVPIYFNLARWVAVWSRVKEDGAHQSAWGWFRRRRHKASASLDTWLIDELVRWYSVPRSAATHLIKNRQVIFCLDGLDELMSGDGFEDADPALILEAQEDCVATINRTLRDGAVQMVLCCREDTHRRLSRRLELGVPLQTQLLPHQESMAYLRQRPSLDGLRAAIEESEVLQARARLPLFLRLMATSYEWKDKRAILNAARQTEQAWDNHLMDNYVHQCLSKATQDNRGYYLTDIPIYLGWLARNMPTTFQVEDFQPSLLTAFAGDAGRAYQRYRWASVASLAAILALCASAPAGLAIGLEWSAFHDLGASVWYGCSLFTAMALTTFVFGLPAFASTRWQMFGGILGLAFGIGRGVVIYLSPAEGLGGTVGAALEAAAVTIPSAIVVFSLFGYQTLGKIEQYKQRYRNRPGIELFEVMPVETYDWLWFDRQNPWRGAWLGLVLGPLIGAVFWALFGPARGIGFGVIITLFVTAFSGQLGTGVRVSLSPNEGIRRSLKHALFMATLISGVSVAAFALSYGTTFGWLQGWVNGLLGLTASFTVLAFGGMAVVRHVCVGQALHRQGVLPSWMGWPPWGKTIAFLDDMVRFKLLRRSASGYAFRHEFLRQFYRRIASDSAAPERLPTSRTSSCPP